MARVEGREGARVVTPVAGALSVRTAANARFFEREAGRLAELCRGVAERISAGGRLLAVGRSGQARSDARHVTVEFVHPVIVGKRAMPALCLTSDRIGLFAEERDVVMVFGGEDGDDETLRALGRAIAKGCLTVDFAGLCAEWSFAPPSTDPFVRQELVETLYHLVWELTHVFFEHRGLRHDPGRTSFLYPFLGGREADAGAVEEDVARSVRAKAGEIGALREQTLGENGAVLAAAAAALRDRFDRGGRILALGNGGSATDAMDLVADLVDPPGGGPSRPALDLTEDTAILTALANDVGVDTVFARQVAAHGRDADTVVAFSTSGGSRNVIHALREARARGLATVALVGYGGGEIASEGLADYAIVTRSEHVPRIQEAQASAYHVLRAMIEDRS